MNEEKVQEYLAGLRKLIYSKKNNKNPISVYPISKKPEKTDKYRTDLIEQFKKE